MIARQTPTRRICMRRVFVHSQGFKMSRLTTVALALLVLTLPACKIVKTPEAGQSAAATTGEAGDDTRIAALLDKTLTADLLPHVAQNARPVSELRAAIAAGLDAAGEKFGHRGAGAGAAWNFAVTGEGRVVEANLTSRARKAMLDTDGDGKSDITLQLGPVIKGTALRDFAPFYDFNDFRDQIEFAKLGRAINDRVSAALVVPEGELAGQTLRFVGAFDLKAPADPWLVTATTLQVVP